MLPDIAWHNASETPPVNKKLLIITDDNAFGVGYYFEFEGEALRAICFWITEPVPWGKKAGSTVMWAVLPSNDDIKEANKS